MKSKTTKKLAMAGVFTALAVVGSMLSVPVASSKCAPVQHMINILSAVFLGPGYSVGIAFVASLLRNILGLGSFLAFPGSMVGALCCGLVYKFSKKVLPTCVAEAFGTGVLGGIAAYPVAKYAMGLQDIFIYYIFQGSFALYDTTFDTATFCSIILRLISIKLFTKFIFFII